MKTTATNIAIGDEGIDTHRARYAEYARQTLQDIRNQRTPHYPLDIRYGGQGYENYEPIAFFSEDIKHIAHPERRGLTIEEYAEVAARLSEFRLADGTSPIGAIECNVSCPNVKEGGHVFGHDPDVLNRLVSAVRKSAKVPLIVKLAPNVTDIRPFVQACEDGGADALSMINTIPAMVIDIEKRVPALANRTGGLSGRGIHPAAVKLVYDARKATKLPILAMGGIYEAKDAIEFMLAGATAVAVGTAIFSDPGVVGAVHDGMVEYCMRHGFSAISELTGALCES
jgi:dihydroorotate dehydrogenase (NAD+) catalytic subunit